jgi:hypothetical protein
MGGQTMKSDYVYTKYHLIAVLILMIIGALYFYNIGGWLIEDDEGTDLYEIWRISEGDVPGKDVITEQPPVFLLGGVGLGLLSDFNVAVLRGASVTLVLGSAWLVFLLGRDVWSPRVGLMGMFVYLLNQQVYRQSRLFRPDPWMLAFSIAGLYFFVQARTNTKRGYLPIAGGTYGIATLCKLFGILPIGGCLLFLIYRALTGLDSFHQVSESLTLLLIPFLLISVGGLLIFYPPDSVYYGTVLGGHWQLGSQKGLTYRIGKGLVHLASFLRHNVAFLFTLPLLHRLAVSHKPGESILAWQVPSGLAYFILSRPLYERYWLYLVPAFSLMFSFLVDHSLRWLESQNEQWRRSLVFLAGLLLIGMGPIQSIPIISRRARLYEKDTQALADYIAARTASDEVVLTDYAGLNFYARRPSVPQASIIAGGRIKGGFITGADLIAEIEARDVKIVALHVSGGTPHHLINLKDFDEFYAYLNDRFCLTDTFNRVWQVFEIYQACSAQEKIGNRSVIPSPAKPDTSDTQTSPAARPQYAR